MRSLLKTTAVELRAHQEEEKQSWVSASGMPAALRRP
jgi:hypothetical protein